MEATVPYFTENPDLHLEEPTHRAVVSMTFNNNVEASVEIVYRPEDRTLEITVVGGELGSPLPALGSTTPAAVYQLTPVEQDLVDCEDCDGHGWEPWHEGCEDQSPASCQSCGGTGQVYA